MQLLPITVTCHCAGVEGLARLLSPIRVCVASYKCQHGSEAALMKLRWAKSAVWTSTILDLPLRHVLNEYVALEEDLSPPPMLKLRRQTRRRT